jgi:F0F1-type ATP synthase membrane subunit b/b'
MMYVLIGLVVVLALISGAEYAMLRVAKAERRAEVAELKTENRKLKDKCDALCNRNKELAERMVRLESIKEGQE